MNFKKFIMTVALVFATTSIAVAKQPELTVISGESAGSTGLIIQTMLLPELEKQFDKVNVITVANCDKAADLYNSINDKPVVYLHFNSYEWLKEKGKHTCGVPVTVDNIWFHVGLPQAICTKGPNPVTFEDFRRAKTYGSIQPHELYGAQISQLNANGLNLKAVPYNGGGGLVLTGILNGEVEYGGVALVRAADLMKDKSLSCFAKFGESTNLLPSIKTFLPKFELGENVSAYVGVGKNFETKNFTEFKINVQKLFSDATPINTDFANKFLEVSKGDANTLYKKYQSQRQIFDKIF